MTDRPIAAVLAVVAAIVFVAAFSAAAVMRPNQAAVAENTASRTAPAASTSELRVATAQGRIVMRPETLRLLLAGEIAKGNVLTTAQIAGVMAAKKTHELIPMCHPLLLTGIAVDLTPDEAASAIEISATGTCRRLMVSKCSSPCCWRAARIAGSTCGV